MPNEIERKFLVNRPLSQILPLYNDVSKIHIEQQYLGDSGKWTVRIRQCIDGDDRQHYLTFKKKISDISCTEIESSIDEKFYLELASQCGPALMKIRHEVYHEGHHWEIDQFLNPEFEHLVVAEIELKSENDFFDLPDWAGQEVTHDKQYKNAKMVQRLISK